VKNTRLNDKFSVSDSNCLLKRKHIEQVSNHLTVNKGVITPVGKLKGAIHKWENIGTSIYILQVIEMGYGIPFKEIPKIVVLRNNKSAINVDFVKNEITKLLEKGCISEVAEAPFVVNPLTVAYSRSNKPHLVLDCRHINTCIHQFKFKFEDGSVARELFAKEKEIIYLNTT
jgi:hypothetical protein